MMTEHLTARAINPPQSLWRRAWFRVVAVAAVLALAGGLTYALWPTPPVYLTDGGMAYSADLQRVENRILAENRQVRESGKPYVSVVLMLPMRRTDSDVFSEDWLRHQLEGSYLAQLKADNAPGSTALDPRSLPHIQLLLADEGSAEQHWREAVDAVARHTGAPDRVVAVTGLGLSLKEAGQAADALATAGPGGRPIPVVAVTTADEYSDKPGLVRVTPSNSEEAKAAAAFLVKRQGKGPAAPAMLVQDANRDDDYAGSLAAEFRRDYPRVVATESYDSSLPGTGTVFGQMQDHICAQRPDVVFFAGRNADLKEFLGKLAGRSCRDKRITVMSGDDASLLAGAPLWDTGSSPDADIEVDLTGLADPHAWASNPAALPGAGQFGDCPICFDRLFPGEPLADGSAITAYDALTTAVQAIRETATPQDPLTSSGAVTQELSHVRGVQGASGWISFDANARPSDPVDKAIPIERLSPDGTLGFVTLSAASADGIPPTGPVQ